MAKKNSISGFGFLFQPRYTHKGESKISNVWWVSYTTDGGRVRESTGFTDRDKAMGRLMELAGDKARGVISNAASRGKVGELLDIYLRSTLGYKSHKWGKYIVDHYLAPRVGQIKISKFNNENVRSLRTDLYANLSKSTTNRCLAILRRAFNLGREEKLVTNPPVIKLMKGEKVRHGIITKEQYNSMKLLLPDHVRITLVIGYHTGMRINEILSLRWDWVDEKAGVITIPEDRNKNERRRIVPIYGEMVDCLKNADRKSEYVVSYHGESVFSIHKSWNAAAKLVGAHILRHDMRRTALTNMENAGIPRHVAMQISGHKTESAYRRYLIGTDKSVVDAGKKMDEWMKSNGPKQGT